MEMFSALRGFKCFLKVCVTASTTYLSLTTSREAHAGRLLVVLIKRPFIQDLVFGSLIITNTVSSTTKVLKISFILSLYKYYTIPFGLCQ